MTTKPELPKWVTDDGAAKISDPGPTKKLAGWLYKEKPPFQFWNWLWNTASKWFLGLQGSYYDIVIGSAAQVTALEATHVLADLVDALAVAGSRVLILDGTHTLLGNLSLTNADLKIKSESPLAILDVSTFTATFSGARDFILLRVTNSGAGDITISGAGSIFEGIDVPTANVTVSGGAVARTSGLSGGLLYPDTIHTKVIDIGDWDLDATDNVTVNHGLDISKIRSAKIIIRNDAGTALYISGANGILAGSFDTSLQLYSIGTTGVVILRIAGSFFDSTDFDATSYNRGWITLEYVD